MVILANYEDTKISRSITRTIKYDLSGTGRDNFPEVHQTVKFVQEAMWGVDANHHRVKAQFGNNNKWVVEGTLSPYGLWDSVKIPQIDDFTAYLEGEKVNKIEAHRVDISTSDTTLVVTYKRNHAREKTSYSQDLFYQTKDGTVIKKVRNALSGTLVYGSATVARADANICINNNMPKGYQYVSGKITTDETINGDSVEPLKIIVREQNQQDVSSSMKPQGVVLITFVEKGDSDHVLGTKTAQGTIGDTIDLTDFIWNNTPKDWHVDSQFSAASVTVPGNVTVPLLEGSAQSEPDYVKNLGLVPQGRSEEGRQVNTTVESQDQEQDNNDDQVNNKQDPFLAKIQDETSSQDSKKVGFASLKLMLGFTDK